MGPPGHIDQECVEAYLFSRPTPRILLFRRPPSRGSIWVPVSGKVETTDPDLPSALRRELEEETGLSSPKLVEDLHWEFPFDGPQGGRWRLHAFAVETEPDFRPTLSAEHDAAEWVDPPEALRRLHYDDNREATRRLLQRFFPTLLPPEGPNV